MSKRSPRQANGRLPLFEVMAAAGGELHVQDLYRAPEVRGAVPAEDLNRRVSFPSDPSRKQCAYEHKVRVGLQHMKARGMVEPLGGGKWRLTDKGRVPTLHQALPGVVSAFIVTDDGCAFFGAAEDAIEQVEDGSVRLCFTSPPYPLLRKKDYGNLHVTRWVDWMLRLMERWPDKLSKDGSIVLNLSDVWEKGSPTVSLYQERLLIRLEEQLGLKLCQRFAWHNTAKPPVPAEYVNIQRIRAKPSLEQVYWLAPEGRMPYAQNRNVLVPYSESMQRLIAAGGQAKAAKRPSGHAFAPGAFGVDNGGAIPSTLITAANTDSNSAYVRLCRAAGLPIHPARFPEALAAFFIKFLTCAGDLVLDAFFGSGTTGKVASALGRRWVGFENVLEYILGAGLRFADAPGFRTPLLDEAAV